MAMDFERLLAELRAGGRLREPPVLEPLAGARARLGDREVLVFCSNDYLDLARNPELGRAAAAAIAPWGVGAGASRLISGTLHVHRAAEERLAALVGLESALLLPSGYHANLGAISAVARAGDVVFSDALNHASLIDGSRLSRAEVHVYPHKDLAALRAALAAQRGRYERAWIVSETLFSMDGSEPDLAGLAELAQRYDAGLLLDEAHALGVFGPGGAGLAAAAGVQPDLLVGTLGKALGCAGAFVAGRRAATEWIANRARSFVFTTAVAPPLAAAAIQSAKLVAAADDRRAQLRELIDHFRGRLTEARLPLLPSRSPIQPVVLGSDARTMSASAALLERGFFVQGIRPPTVPDGASRLRVTLTAAHTLRDVNELAMALVSVCETL